MKDKISCLLILFFLFALTSCNSENEAVEISDCNSVALALVDGLDFGDDLEKTNSMSVVLKKYDIDAHYVSELSRYVGSGATADEVAVFKCTSDEAVTIVKAAVEDRIKYLHDGYSDYGPSEVPKIDDAKVLQYGSYIVFCISNNSSQAEGIIENLNK